MLGTLITEMLGTLITEMLGTSQKEFSQVGTSQKYSPMPQLPKSVLAAVFDASVCSNRSA